MISPAGLISALLIGVAATVASPSPVPRQSITELTPSQVGAYKPYALLARAAFCPPAKLENWSCGTACNELQEMQVYAVNTENPTEGGWFVGYYPELKTIVVSNQGTDPSEAVSSVTDADFFLTPLDPSRFPGVPSQVQVHNELAYTLILGFEFSQAMSADAKLAAVQALMSRFGSSEVTLTGLGRGGAISLIDAVFLSLHLPSSKFTVVTHGMPRVGNQAFADYVDSHLSDVSRITNKQDPLPILPETFLGFHHTSGEKHIVAGNFWVACSGQDNTDSQCSAGDVPNIFEGNPEDNKGPYDGVIINGDACDE